MKRKKIVFVFLIIILILSLISLIPRIIMVYNFKTNFSRTQTPGLYAIMTNRTINKEHKKDGKGEGISCYNLYFEINGRELSRDETSQLTSIEFDDGRKILIQDKTDYILTDTLYEGFSESELEKVKDLFGESIFLSDYSFYENILNVSPDQVSYFTAKKDIVSKHVLLNFKSFLQMPSWQDGVYGFKIDQIKGFQFGVPRKSNLINIQFYDEEDNEYSILLKGQDFTQDEIDSILTTLSIN